MAPRKKTAPVPAPSCSEATLARPDHEGLTEDELEEVRIALSLDDPHAGLSAVLAGINALDREQTILREVRETFDLDLNGDLETAVREYRDAHDELVNDLGCLVDCAPEHVAGDLEELAQDLREIVAILEPRLGGFRDDEPAEIRDLRVAVDRISRRLPRLGDLR